MKGEGKQAEASEVKEWTQAARRRPLAHNEGRRPESQLRSIVFGPSLPCGITPARP